MSDERNLVLVTTGTDEYALPYVESLRAVGVPAEFIRVVTPQERDAVADLASRAVGLVLCGGVDIAPELYGEEPLPEAGIETLPERDELEVQLILAMREALTPIWAICRGLQLLNVLLGGSLWQDLPSQRPSEINHQILEPKDLIAHSIKVTQPETCLGRILSCETVSVNSRHHQAINRLAEGFVPVAQSPDGLVEAIELANEGEWWVKAVQWHPENLIALPQQRALWEEFARVIGERL